MSNLKYKTRGNSSPQGKSRVYFCCHPEDFNRCFESISDEILAKQNCAVWYTDEVIVHDEDFFLDLKQMQLFVMPITTNLLCTENEAIDIEFKFAIENHIPVLPLMQESGLEKIFNKRCGDLQFLDKNNTDVTAISYDEKLKKYLETVLIGDELAEKIRAAFDAYVFLSYRKKDRRYAQELMRLIHKNEFCRDMAIWYDEFLTPGENFNDSIKVALQKSGLFVLTVTPNLVNEINYIMTTEYPIAKQEGKPILPAELVPTNREQLSEKYEDIPNPADAHNEAELSKALLESIKKIAIKENDNSPEHNFFVGLAYLGGVDVEVNIDYALHLITLAANSNFEFAISKLVDIYINGIGVDKDLRTALMWQEKLVDILQNNFYSALSENNDKIVSNGVVFFESLIKYGILHSSNKDRIKAKKIFIDAYKLIQKLQDKTILPMFLLNRTAHCLVESACCEMNDGNFDLAIDLLKKAIEQYEECPLNCTINIAKTYLLIGDALVHSNADDAIENYKKSMDILKSYLIDCDNWIAKLYLAQIYSKLAKIVGNGINSYYELATDLYSQVDAEKYDINVKLDYFWFLTQYGDMLYHAQEIEKAIQKFCELFDIAVSIEENENITNNESLLELVSVAYYKMFIASMERNNKDGALAFLDETELYLSRLLRIKPNDECYRKRYDDVRKYITIILNN